MVVSFTMKLLGNDGRESAQQYCCASRITAVGMMDNLMALPCEWCLMIFRTMRWTVLYQLLSAERFYGRDRHSLGVTQSKRYANANIQVPIVERNANSSSGVPKIEMNKNLTAKFLLCMKDMRSYRLLRMDLRGSLCIIYQMRPIIVVVVLDLIAFSFRNPACRPRDTEKITHDTMLPYR
jgi:hypothetical protein